jgi:uncharacterized cupredoxin-like copper-binding protein
VRSCFSGSRCKRSLASAGLAVSLIALSACSSQAPRPVGAAIPVTLEDYRILSSVKARPAGRVSFDVHNRGPSTHEFVVFRTDQPADQLPLATDGLTIDEDSSFLHHVGEFSQVDIGRSRTLTLWLPSGTYVLVCNLEGHYLGGMHLAITVL